MTNKGVVFVPHFFLSEPTIIGEPSPLYELIVNARPPYDAIGEHLKRIEQIIETELIDRLKDGVHELTAREAVIIQNAALAELARHKISAVSGSYTIVYGYSVAVLAALDFSGLLGTETVYRVVEPALDRVHRRIFSKSNRQKYGQFLCRAPYDLVSGKGLDCLNRMASQRRCFFRDIRSSNCVTFSGKLKSLNLLIRDMQDHFPKLQISRIVSAPVTHTPSCPKFTVALKTATWAQDNSTILIGSNGTSLLSSRSRPEDINNFIEENYWKSMNTWSSASVLDGLSDEIVVFGGKTAIEFMKTLEVRTPIYYYSQTFLD